MGYQINTIEEFQKLINNKFSLLLIDTSNITNLESLFENQTNNSNYKSKNLLEYQ